MALRSGFNELKQAVDKQKQGFTPAAGKLNYFSMEAGEIKIVRFLDDEIITTKFYEWLMNNKGEKTEFICAPDLYRHDPSWTGQDWVQKWKSPTPGIGWAVDYQTKALKEPKLAERTVGMAVLKEQVEIDGVKSIRDFVEEIEVDDEKYLSLHFMLVKQALSNFWDQMVGYHGLYGTICDRDYRIERKGDGLKTTYQAIPLSPDPDWVYGSDDEPSPSLLALQALYGYGVNITKAEGPDPDADNPEGYTWANRYLYAPTTVEDWCIKRASEDFAAFWMDPNAEHLQAEDKAKQRSAGVSAEALMAARGQTPAAPPAATAPAPATTAATAPAAPSAPAAPATGDRFEQMRQNMAGKKTAATT